MAILSLPIAELTKSTLKYSAKWESLALWSPGDQYALQCFPPFSFGHLDFTFLIIAIIKDTMPKTIINKYIIIGKYHCPNSFPISGLPLAFCMLQNRTIDKRADPETMQLKGILAFSQFKIYDANKSKKRIPLNMLMPKANSTISIFSFIFISKMIIYYYHIILQQRKKPPKADSL